MDHPKPEISRYAFAMFDVLGFSNWVENADLQTILDAYQALIEKAVTRPNEKGGLSAVQTPEGSIFAVIGPPHYAYFSDTILLWCPLMPPLVDDFVGRCSDLICEALAMDIPLRGALTLGDAVLDSKSNIFIGKPIVEAANLEKGQNWIGLTFGNTAIWSPFLAQIHGTAIIEYQPPMKLHYEEFSSPIVIDWPRKWRDKFGECPSSKLRQLNRSHEKSLYWDNTVKFCEYSFMKHDWHLRAGEIPENALLKLIPRKEAKY
jgi:hypothetical protein